MAGPRIRDLVLSLHLHRFQKQESRMVRFHEESAIPRHAAQRGQIGVAGAQRAALELAGRAAESTR